VLDGGPDSTAKGGEREMGTSLTFVDPLQISRLSEGRLLILLAYRQLRTITKSRLYGCPGRNHVTYF